MSLPGFGTSWIGTGTRYTDLSISLCPIFEHNTHSHFHTAGSGCSKWGVVVACLWYA